MNSRTMNLGAFVHETGQHVAAWRHPDAYAESGTVFAQAMYVARTAERGRFDLLFLADSAAVSVFGTPESRGRMGKTVKFEPITLLSALAAVTSHLGLVATCTSTSPIGQNHRSFAVTLPVVAPSALRYEWGL